MAQPLESKGLDGSARIKNEPAVALLREFCFCLRGFPRDISRSATKKNPLNAILVHGF